MPLMPKNINYVEKVLEKSQTLGALSLIYHSFSYRGSVSTDNLATNLFHNRYSIATLYSVFIIFLRLRNTRADI